MSKNSIVLIMLTLLMGIAIGFSLAISSVQVGKLQNGDIVLTWLGQDFIHYAPLDE